MKEVTIEDLKIVSEFQQVPNDQLEWLISQGEPQELQKNELLFNAGEPVVTCYILLEGKMRICAVQSGNWLSSLFESHRYARVLRGNKRFTCI